MLSTSNHYLRIEDMTDYPYGILRDFVHQRHVQSTASKARRRTALDRSGGSRRPIQTLHRKEQKSLKDQAPRCRQQRPDAAQRVIDRELKKTTHSEFSRTMLWPSYLLNYCRKRSLLLPSQSLSPIRLIHILMNWGSL